MITWDPPKNITDQGVMVTWDPPFDAYSLYYQNSSGNLYRISYISGKKTQEIESTRNVDRAGERGSSLRSHSEGTPDAVIFPAALLTVDSLASCTAKAQNTPNICLSFLIFVPIFTLQSLEKDSPWKTVLITILQISHK